MRRPQFISVEPSGYSYFCAFFVGIGSLLWGYDSGIVGTAQAQTYFEEKFHPSSAMLGGIISVYTAGGAIGAVVAAIGTAIQTASVNTPMLVVGRLIAGLAIGIIYFTIPQFQSEITPASHRGFFVGLHAQFIGFGYALSNWIGFGVYFGKGQFTFRFPVGLQIFWAELLLVGSVFLPRSPSWLIEKGRYDEARKVMSRLRAPNADPEYPEKEFVQMRDQIEYEAEHQETSLIGILRKPSYRKRLILGCLIQIGQQICAIVAVYSGSDNKVANGFGIFFLILFGVLFSLSWNSGAPVYTTEIFPTLIRAVGGAISTFWSFVIQVVLAQASPTALQNVGWRYYFFFIACNLVSAILVYFFLPETHGVSLAEISEVFGDQFVSVHMNEALKTAPSAHHIEGLEGKTKQVIVAGRSEIDI
ncbi:hypothetical protein ZTR_09005 [Talaromyces verruculosus]|nr:hypothetical protein ZTR_09005 [Talaromyces verruculosus]